MKKKFNKLYKKLKDCFKKKIFMKLLLKVFSFMVRWRRRVGGAGKKLLIPVTPVVVVRMILNELFSASQLKFSGAGIGRNIRTTACDVSA